MGCFGSTWVGDNVQGRIFGSSIFWVVQAKKFKFARAEHLGDGCRNASVSQKAKKFWEGGVLMKCSILFQGLSGSICF